MDCETAKKTCAKRALYLRQEKGLTQELLAKKLGTHSQTISRLEHDGCFSLKLLLKYCDYLGVTLDWLFGVDEGCGTSWWRT